MSHEYRDKVTQNMQKKNFEKFIENIKSEPARQSVINAVYFPESGDFIRKVVEIKRTGKPPIEEFFPLDQALIKRNIERAIFGLVREPLLLCLFPDFSIQDNMAVSEFPLLEIEGSGIRPVLHEVFDQSDFVHVFMCATPDLKKGLFFSVRAGNPAISGSDAPICNVFAWGGFN